MFYRILFFFLFLCVSAQGRDLSNLTTGEMNYAANVHYDTVTADLLKPYWHLTNPSGHWWDINGATYYNGKYHIFFLRNKYNPQGEMMLNVWSWGHASSRDMLHWRFHKDIFVAGAYSGEGPHSSFYSGDVIDNLDEPVLVISDKGVHFAKPKDADLLEWEIDENFAVLPPTDADPYIMFDPYCWYDKEKGEYNLLLGNKYKGGEPRGDTTSLFKSKELKDFQYVGRFYDSKREFTGIHEDCACVDFFPLGDKWVMFNHNHQPTTAVRYYIGTKDDTTFTPEKVGRFGTYHNAVFAPESFYDPVHNRRVLYCSLIPSGRGWAISASVPMEVSLHDDGNLKVVPIRELESLLYDKESMNFSLENSEKKLEKMGSLSCSYDVKISGDYESAGVKIASASDESEFLKIEYIPQEKIVRIDFEKSRADERTVRAKYAGEAIDGNQVEKQIFVTTQDIPVEIPDGEDLHLRILRDGCIVELFINDRFYCAEYIYPKVPYTSVEAKAFVKGKAKFKIDYAKIDAAMSL